MKEAERKKIRKMGEDKVREIGKSRNWTLEENNAFYLLQTSCYCHPIILIII